MEVLGQGFALPLEELPIAQNITQVYSQWLFEPHNRPLAFKQVEGTPDEQRLYQVCCMGSLISLSGYRRGRTLANSVLG